MTATRLTQESIEEAHRLKAFQDAWTSMDFLEQIFNRQKLSEVIAEQIAKRETTIGPIHLKLSCDVSEEKHTNKEITANITIDYSKTKPEIRITDLTGKLVSAPILYEPAGRTFTCAFAKHTPPKPMTLSLDNPKENTPRLGVNQQKGLFRLQHCIAAGNPSQLGVFGPASGKSWIQGMTTLAGGGKGIYSVPKKDLADELKTGALEPIYKAYGLPPNVFISGKDFNSVQELQKIMREEKTYNIILTAEDKQYDDYAGAIAGHRICIDESHQLTESPETLATLTKFATQCYALALTGTPTKKLTDLFKGHMIDINSYHAAQIGKVRKGSFYEAEASSAFIKETAALHTLSNIAYRHDKPGIQHVKEYVHAIKKGELKIDSTTKIRTPAQISAAAAKLALQDAAHNVKVKGFILSTDPNIRRECVEFLNTIRQAEQKESKGYTAQQIQEFCHLVYARRRMQENNIRVNLFREAYKEACKGEKSTPTLEEAVSEYRKSLLKETRHAAPLNPVDALKGELQSVQKEQIAYSINAIVLSLLLNLPLKTVEAEIRNNKIIGTLTQSLAKSTIRTEPLKSAEIEKLLVGLPANQHKEMFKLVKQFENKLLSAVKHSSSPNDRAHHIAALLATPDTSVIDLERLHAKYIMNVDDVIPSNDTALSAARDSALAQIRFGLVQIIAAGKELATGTDIQTLTSTVTISHDAESASAVHITQAQARGKRSGDFDIAFDTHIHTRPLAAIFSPRQAFDPHFIVTYTKQQENEEKIAARRSPKKQSKLKIFKKKLEQHLEKKLEQSGIPRSPSPLTTSPDKTPTSKWHQDEKEGSSPSSGGWKKK